VISEKISLTHPYACVGATSFGGRCRKMGQIDLTKPVGWVCPAHINSEDAPGPHTILIKFRIPREWARELEIAGIRNLGRPDLASQEAYHRAEAEKWGRKAEVGGVVASGTQVFGEDGIRGAHLSTLPTELFKAGLRLCQPDLARATKGKGQDHVLILPFSQIESGEEVSNLPPKVERVMESLFRATWRWGHIWANPPEEKKSWRITHTVNVSGMGDRTALQKDLLFARGLWSLRLIT